MERGVAARETGERAPPVSGLRRDAGCAARVAGSGDPWRVDATGIEKLVRHRRITAAIVSGRRRRDLIGHVRLARVQCWGLYGWERGRARALPRDVTRELADARACLTAGVRQMPGVILEDKGLSLAVHTRGASLDVEQQAWALLKRVLGRHEASHLHVLRGRSVREVLPREIGGKGVAMRAAIKRLRAPFLPIYVGDDATDEAAVAVLGRGITVRVGSWPRTHARYWLADPDEVRRFLERLEGELS